MSSGESTPRAVFKNADQNYFEAAGIPLLKGRAFTTTDRRESARVVVLSKSFAEKLFGTQDPIGRRVAWTGEVLKFIPVSGDWRTVVGVVGDTRDQGLDSDPTPTMYEPLEQEYSFYSALIAKTKGDPALVGPAAVRAIREIYPR